MFHGKNQTHRIEVAPDALGVTITLATGEELHVSFTDRLGVEGYGVSIIGSKLLAILPTSGNAAVITSPRAMQQLEERVQAVVKARDAAKQTRKTGRPS